MSANNKQRWITLSVVTAALFIKSALYRYICGMDGSLDAGQTVTAYIAVTAAALGLGTIGWCRGRWCVPVLMVIADLWFLAGSWYYLANHVWLNWSAVSTIGELRGFESSILSYLDWKQVLYPLSSFLAIEFLRRMPIGIAGKRDWLIAVSMVVVLGAGAAIGRKMFGLSEERKITSFRAEETFFICTHSTIGQIGYIIYDGLQEGAFNRQSSQPFTEREEQIMAECLRPSSEGQAPQGHLAYILVESAETWALEAEDKEGQPVCPYLQEYIRSHPMLYVPGVVSLQRYGRSGDGQLICQTGLLPISHGVACRQYGKNTYPNLAHFYEDGIVLNPYRIPVWNQEEVTYSYGFRQLQGTHKLRNEKDSVVLERTRACLERATKPTAVLTLTIDTHTPFQSAQDSIAIDERYSPIEQAYLRSMHYTDRQIGRFLAWADTATVMKNATIVITADHNHFPREDGKGICPLIVVSPAIKEYKTIPEALQMDLFPTVLHAIGQCDYAWKGFGIDLLDEKADSLLEARPISVQEAYLLSDKLICTNFFAK